MNSTDRYNCIRRLGQGGYGEVFMARDKISNNHVAVKKIRMAAESKKIERESELLKRCESAFIVRYYNVVQNDYDLWIVMEYCHCGSIGSFLRSGNRLTEEELREIASCSLLGLFYLHNCMIMHRDIKPDNLFISETGIVKLGDFGLAVQLEHTCSRRSTTCGTSFYMAPEAYDGKSSLKSDVWSLGISLIEMAEGKNPFAGKSSVMVMNRVINSAPPSLSSSKWSPSFVDFVSRCLVKDMNERGSVKDLMEHPFVKDSIERIVTDGTSALLSAIASRIRGIPQPAAQMEAMRDTNVELMTRVGKKVGEKVVNCDSDFFDLNDTVKCLLVNPMACNDMDITDFSLRTCKNLAELVVGDSALKFVNGLELVGFASLEVVEIGADAFSQGSGGVFEVRQCPQLKTVTIGNGCFPRCAEILFCELPCLEKLALGMDVFCGEETGDTRLVMKNLSALKELTGRVRALKNVKEVCVEEVPNLTKCMLLTAFKCVEKAQMTNASMLGEMEQLKNAGREVCEAKPCVIECNGDWEAMNTSLTRLEITNGSYNDARLTIMDFGRLKNLKEVKIGDDCCEEVVEVKWSGLNHLQSIVVGENSFTKKKKTWPKEVNHARKFYLRNCAAVKTVKIGNYSFSDYSVCVMEGLPSLEQIEIGDLIPENSCFSFYFASLELKSLPKLKKILMGWCSFAECVRLVLENLPELERIELDHSVFRFIDDNEDTTLIMRNLPKLTSLTSVGKKSWTFLRPRHVIMEDMPSLTEVRLAKPFKYRDDIHMENVNAMSSILDQPLPDSDDDCCILWRVCC